MAANAVIFLRHYYECVADDDTFEQVLMVLLS
jgi:hypothetical protein